MRKLGVYTVATVLAVVMLWGTMTFVAQLVSAIFATPPPPHYNVMPIAPAGINERFFPGFEPIPILEDGDDVIIPLPNIEPRTDMTPVLHA